MFREDKAVSPVIGEILMVVVAVVIAVMLIAFAYHIVWSVTEVPSIDLLIEGAEIGSSNITIIHMGGNKIGDAFAPSYTYNLNASIFKNLEVRINGAVYEGWASLNGGAISKSDFAGGDELELGLNRRLSLGDTISVVYVPGGQILAREVV